MVGEFDITVVAVVGIAAIIVAKLGQEGVPLLVLIFAAGGAGGVIGLVNAFCVNVLGVTSLITTLGVASVVTGITTYLTDGSTVSDGVPSKLLDFAQGYWLGIPQVVVCVLVVAIVMWYLTSRTPLGRRLYATGMNREAARLMGAGIKRNITLAFVTSGIIAGLSGVLQLGIAQSAAPDTGASFLLPALTVAFLGASAIRPGWFNVWGTVVGVLVVGTGIVGLSILGAPYWVQPIFNGAILVVAVAVSTFSLEPFRSFARALVRGRSTPKSHGGVA
jgi:ribose transport system permease protein